MKLALGLSYVGSAYYGWQRQPALPTVQGKLEAALLAFARKPIETYCAGRTDAGVHALNQVVHLTTDLDRPDISWVRGVNQFLPADIAVQWCCRVPENFHARFCATSRRYAYLLLESPVRPAIESARVGWVFQPLSLIGMQTAAQYLIGEHDFSAFRSSQCQARSPVKHLHSIHIQRKGAYWRFDFHASAFLHHMVRNIMGCLIAVGRNDRPCDWVVDVLISRKRQLAAPTFAAQGLYFIGPSFDAQWALPTGALAFDWLPMS